MLMLLSRFMECICRATQHTDGNHWVSYLCEFKTFFSKLVNEEKHRYKTGHLPSGLQCRGLTYSFPSLLIGYWRKINEVCYPSHNILYSEIILVEQQQQQSQKNENSNKNTFLYFFSFSFLNEILVNKGKGQN